MVFDGRDGGDMSWSVDFGIPLTGADSNVPGWDTFDPPYWNMLRGAEVDII